MSNDPLASLISECQRQEESCLYTSTALFEWLKSLRFWRVIFIVVPIILGGVATWPLLTKNEGLHWVTGLCALLAGMFPAISKALAWDGSVATLAKQAHQFKILQDRFRQAWRVTALEDYTKFRNQFDDLMTRMDEARAMSVTAPERFFTAAQKKIKKGDYDFNADAGSGQNGTRRT